MDASGRVINLSSAGQSPVDPDALAGRKKISDEFKAYTQSKLAITMWSRHMAQALKDHLKMTDVSVAIHICHGFRPTLE